MVIPAVHKTDYRSAESILKKGFDLARFGSATNKTGQSDLFKQHPRGIYLTEDEGFAPESVVSHPWDHRDRGVLLFCSVRLDNPFLAEPRPEGKFYQAWLSEKYGGLSGGRLTEAMRRDGYDGIYCEKTGEVVAFNPEQISIDTEKSQKSLSSYKGFREWLRSNNS